METRTERLFKKVQMRIENESFKIIYSGEGNRYYVKGLKQNDRYVVNVFDYFSDDIKFIFELSIDNNFDVVRITNAFTYESTTILDEDCALTFIENQINGYEENQLLETIKSDSDIDEDDEEVDGMETTSFFFFLLGAITTIAAIFVATNVLLILGQLFFIHASFFAIGSKIIKSIKGENK